MGREIHLKYQWSVICYTAWGTLLGYCGLQTFVRLNAEEDVEVAVVAAAAPGVALAAHAQPATIVHARGDAQIDLRPP